MGAPSFQTLRKSVETSTRRVVETAKIIGFGTFDLAKRNPVATVLLVKYVCTLLRLPSQASTTWRNRILNEKIFPILSIIPSFITESEYDAHLSGPNASLPINTRITHVIVGGKIRRVPARIKKLWDDGELTLSSLGHLMFYSPITLESQSGSSPNLTESELSSDDDDSTLGFEGVENSTTTLCEIYIFNPITENSHRPHMSENANGTYTFTAPQLLMFYEQILASLCELTGDSNDELPLKSQSSKKQNDDAGYDWSIIYHHEDFVKLARDRNIPLAVMSPMESKAMHAFLCEFWTTIQGLNKRDARSAKSLLSILPSDSFQSRDFPLSPPQIWVLFREQTRRSDFLCGLAHQGDVLLNTKYLICLLLGFKGSMYEKHITSRSDYREIINGHLLLDYDETKSESIVDTIYSNKKEDKYDSLHSKIHQSGKAFQSVLTEQDQLCMLESIFSSTRHLYHPCFNVDLGFVGEIDLYLRYYDFILVFEAKRSCSKEARNKAARQLRKYSQALLPFTKRVVGLAYHPSGLIVREDIGDETVSINLVLDIIKDFDPHGVLRGVKDLLTSQASKSRKSEALPLAKPAPVSSVARNAANRTPQQVWSYKTRNSKGKTERITSAGFQSFKMDSIFRDDTTASFNFRANQQRESETRRMKFGGGKRSDMIAFPSGDADCGNPVPTAKADAPSSQLDSVTEETTDTTVV